MFANVEHLLDRNVHHMFSRSYQMFWKSHEIFANLARNSRATSGDVLEDAELRVQRALDEAPLRRAGQLRVVEEVVEAWRLVGVRGLGSAKLAK